MVAADLGGQHDRQLQQREQALVPAVRAGAGIERRRVWAFCASTQAATSATSPSSSHR